MKIVEKLQNRWKETDHPFLVHSGRALRFDEIANVKSPDLSQIKCGDVVALIGDFNPHSIVTLLELIDMDVIVVPLTSDTRIQHDYFFEAALVDVVVEGNSVKRIAHIRQHELIQKLRSDQRAGLILFSTGTTGRPKAILHDLTLFMKRFDTPRPALKAISFLLFDHIGGINTLLHTLFNKGTVVAPETRTVENILELCIKHEIEVLPTTPTFLRMMLLSGLIPNSVPNTLKIITYGTERMDQPTLDAVCDLLPNVDFRQTYGMSELGIVRVKSEARNSLFMKVGGEGVETRVVGDVLEIRSETRMLGYLNAKNPFDSNGWYNTNDIVETKNDYCKIIGRINEVINVGGLKFMASEVERVALTFPMVKLVKAIAKQNPITGQHVELLVQPNEEKTFDKNQLMTFLKDRLEKHQVPKRIRVETIAVGHRFKKS